MYLSDILLPENCIRISDDCFVVDVDILRDEVKQWALDYVIDYCLFGRAISASVIHKGIYFKLSDGRWTCGVYSFNTGAALNSLKLESTVGNPAYYADILLKISTALS